MKSKVIISLNQLSEEYFLGKANIKFNQVLEEVAEEFHKNMDDDTLNE